MRASPVACPLEGMEENNPYVITLLLKERNQRKYEVKPVLSARIASLAWGYEIILTSEPGRCSLISSSHGV